MKSVVHFTVIVSFALSCLAAASVAFAADLPEMPAPQKEHEWLKQFHGTWETKSKASFGPGQPEMNCDGTTESKPLGGFWVVSQMKSEMMGSPMMGQQTIGYDSKKKAYVGTWVDSMTDHMWIYKGSVDDSGKILTLEAEGPDVFNPGTTKLYRDVYEFKSKDEIAISSQVQGDDGKWTSFMSGTAKRKQ